MRRQPPMEHTDKRKVKSKQIKNEKEEDWQYKLKNNNKKAAKSRAKGPVQRSQETSSQPTNQIEVHRQEVKLQRQKNFWPTTAKKWERS